MDVAIEKTDDRSVHCRVSGEIDADNCAQVREALAATEGGAPVSVVVDMSAVSFIDSSGISALLDARDAAVADGGSFRLERPSDSVRRVLEITGLLETFGLS